jgi:carbamate kinase
MLQSITLPEAKFYLNNGHFAEGSMQPKIEAAIEFLDAGGTEVIITDPEHLAGALAGSSGTHLRRK